MQPSATLLTHGATTSPGNDDRSDRRPTILIDASPVTKTVDGLAIYIVNLIKHLPHEATQDFDITVLLNPGIGWSDLDDALTAADIRVMRAPIATIGPQRDWDMFRFLRKYRGRFDLIHITSHNYPLALKGGLCTIHDVTYRDWFAGEPGRPPGWAAAARLYLDLVIRRCLDRAKIVIAVSHSTRAELLRHFGDRGADIRVIHEGWEHVAQQAGECAPFAFEVQPFLFFLGSYRLHKNLAGLLKGFALALADLPAEARLVISGTSDRLSDSDLSLVDAINADGERVVFTGYVSNACVARLYRQATAFILPSLSEGFGLPVLEAFHHGAPLLAANRTSLPEVAGDGALYFDPYDPRDMAKAIVRAFGEPALRKTLRAAGRRRLEHFSWDAAARQTVDLYREALSR